MLIIEKIILICVEFRPWLRSPMATQTTAMTKTMPYPRMGSLLAPQPTAKQLWGPNTHDFWSWWPPQVWVPTNKLANLIWLIWFPLSCEVLLMPKTREEWWNRQIQLKTKKMRQCINLFWKDCFRCVCVPLCQGTAGPWRRPAAPWDRRRRRPGVQINRH